MMARNQFHQNLKTISVQPPDTILITSEGEHIRTQQHLLSAVSPSWPPCWPRPDTLVRPSLYLLAVKRSGMQRYVIHKLGSVDEGADEIEGLGFFVANVLGIEYLKEK